MIITSDYVVADSISSILTAMCNVNISTLPHEFLHSTPPAGFAFFICVTTYEDIIRTGLIFCSTAYLDKLIIYDLIDDASPVWMQLSYVFIRDLLIFNEHPRNLFALFAPPPSYEAIAGTPPPSPPASPDSWESDDPPQYEAPPASPEPVDHVIVGTPPASPDSWESDDDVIVILEE